MSKLQSTDHLRCLCFAENHTWHSQISRWATAEQQPTRSRATLLTWAVWFIVAALTRYRRQNEKQHVPQHTHAALIVTSERCVVTPGPHSFRVAMIWTSCGGGVVIWSVSWKYRGRYPTLLLTISSCNWWFMDRKGNKPWAIFQAHDLEQLELQI